MWVFWSGSCPCQQYISAEFYSLKPIKIFQQLERSGLHCHIFQLCYFFLQPLDDLLSSNLAKAVANMSDPADQSQSQSQDDSVFQEKVGSILGCIVGQVFEWYWIQSCKINWKCLECQPTCQVYFVIKSTSQLNKRNIYFEEKKKKKSTNFECCWRNSLPLNQKVQTNGV